MTDTKTTAAPRPARAITVPRLFVMFIPVLAAASSHAQEGFPLDGTWRGEWGADAGSGTPIVMTMEWDGENINGMINPGPSSVPFSSASLDAGGWTVHITATTADSVPIEIEGRLQDIGSYNRFIEGTWTQGQEEHPFRITRE